MVRSVQKPLNKNRLLGRVKCATQFENIKKDYPKIVEGGGGFNIKSKRTPYLQINSKTKDNISATESYSNLSEN